jgi:hypothetical protein
LRSLEAMGVEVVSHWGELLSRNIVSQHRLPLRIMSDTPPVARSMLTLNFPSYHDTEMTSEKKERTQAKGERMGWDR